MTVTREVRRVIVDAIVERLTEFGVTVLVASMDGTHLHVLAKFPHRDPRIRLGNAKQYATKKTKPTAPQWESTWA